MGAAAAVHPTDPTLQAYGLGKLDDASAESVNKHLESCPDCQRRVAEMSSDSFLGRLRQVQGQPDSTGPVVSSIAGLSMLDTGASSPARPASSTLPPGLADHPDYEVVRELGQGGMGTVYLALNRLMDRHEVLKVVSSHLVKRHGVPDRFLVEIRNAARLHHTNIVTAYSALRFGESIIFAMEYVEGLDLAKLVKAKGALPVSNACNYVHQAALGLQHAHELGMVHRDIKPSNLMLARQGDRAVIKVLDFGLAKIRSEGAIDGGLTHEGQMLGTPDYIAPEQISDARQADIRADIYSLGCTLYHLLTGGPPFQATSLYEILQAHNSMDAMPLNLARPEVPVELAALVAKMMAKEPERRFQTPKEVAQALQPFFKKGNAGAAGSKAEMSQDGGADEGRVPTVVRTASTQPATNLAPSPAPSLKTPAATARPQPMWKSLVEVKQNEPMEQSATANAKPARQKPLRLWSAVAAGMLLLGLVVAWGVILRVKTSNGTIELVNLPRDAEVFVDGEEVAVTWPGGGKPAVVTVTAGKHKVKVKKDGLETSGEEVTVQAEGKEKFTVRLVAPTKPPHELPKDDGADSPPTVNRDARPDAGPTVKTNSAQRSIRNSIGMTLKLIPSGEFMMGSPDNEKGASPSEKPQHKVRISPFYLGIYEVTQGQYRAVMGNNPSNFKGSGDLPVESVSWLDSVNFCNKLSEKGGSKPFYEIDGNFVRVLDWNGPGYRLPTEAEWEYACRAGEVRKYSFGDDEAGLSEYDWYESNSDSSTHPVGEKSPNGFGLFGMHGNVCEWCWDGNSQYKGPPADDPHGPDGASCRVIRGGSFLHSPGYCRSAFRTWYAPEFRWGNLGFRLALNPSDGIKDLSESIMPGIPSSKKSKTAQPKELSPPSRAANEPAQVQANDMGGNGDVHAGVVGRPDAGPALETPSSEGSIKNSIGMTLKLIPAGEFLMGSPDNDGDADNDEKPLHRVRITRPFYLGVYEVTQAKYEAVMGNNPSYFSANGGGKNSVVGQSTDRHPVEGVSWLDAVKFCDKLSEMEGRPAFYEIDGEKVRVPDWNRSGYRLPTEAEWEYACRANAPTVTRYSFGDDVASLGEFAWFDGNSGGRTHPVGEKRPNGLGLFDMHGNVWEWCWDGYGEGYYKQSGEDDPRGLAGAPIRVRRGGGWNRDPRFARSASRGKFGMGGPGHYRGFRLALVARPIAVRN
jgi:formylglycine-generating enzyme required for sulfatase activity/serine/threonine protein kinase